MEFRKRVVDALERIALAQEHKYLIEEQGMEIARGFSDMIGEIVAAKDDVPDYVESPQCSSCTHFLNCDDASKGGLCESYTRVEDPLPVFDEASDDARDPTMEPCPNCASLNVMLHGGHDAVSELGDPSGTGHYHCEECQHIFPFDVTEVP